MKPKGEIYVIVLVTCPDRETAGKLSDLVLKEKLAACVNIVPNIHSFFLWHGRFQSSEEVLMIIKTKGSLLKQMTKRIKENHPYENPEVIALPIVGGSRKYAKWIDEETKKLL
jgi:periplasmic divalent cation tolerance protein